jgi:translocation protein SEC62
MMLKAQRVPGDKKKVVKRLLPYEEVLHGGCCDDDHCQDNKNNDDDKNRMPTKEEIKVFEPNMCYVLDIERGKSKTYTYLFLIVGGVLLACMMPVWPYELKLGIWWVSYVLLVISVGLILVRLAIYALMYVFGFEFWVFPDLQNDKLGVIDSFRKLYSIEKRDENVITILVRIALAGCFGYLAYHVYVTPNAMNDFSEHVQEILKDLFDYGEEKLVNYGVILHNIT